MIEHLLGDLSKAPKLDSTLALPSEAKPYRVAVIGGGFSGVATAINLLRDATPEQPVAVQLIERSPQQMAGGVAYGQAGPEHFTNIPARLMSAFPDRPFHLVKWLARREDALLSGNAGPNRAAMPAPVQKIRLSQDRFDLYSEALVPRRLYQLYLTDTLNEVAAFARKVGNGTLQVVEGEVENVVEPKKGGSYQLVFKGESQPPQTGCDAVVLATGHLKAAAPGFLRSAAESTVPVPIITDLAAEQERLDAYIKPNRTLLQAWQETATTLMAPVMGAMGLKMPGAETPALRTPQHILIIGTGLSAYDAVLSLKQRGWFKSSRHTVELVSRNGLTHPHSAPPHDLQERAAALRPALKRALEQADLSSERGVLIAAEQIHKQFVVVKGTPMPVVTAALMPLLPGLIANCGLSPQTVGRLYKEHNARINTGTVGVGREVAEQIDALRRSGQLTIKAASVHEVRPTADGRVAVRMTPHGEWREETRTVDMVVSALPAEVSYARPPQGLYAQLLKDRRCKPETRLGIGLECDEDRRLVADHRRASVSAQRIYAIGPQIAGRTILTEGMVGPFVLNVPTLRRHAQEVAQQVLADALQPRLDADATLKARRTITPRMPRDDDASLIETATPANQDSVRPVKAVRQPKR